MARIFVAGFEKLYWGGAVLLGICPGAQGAAGVVEDPDCEFGAVFVLPEGVVEAEGELGVVEVDPLGAVLATQGAGVFPGVLVCALPLGCTPGTGAGAVGVVPLCGVDGAGCVCGVDGEFCV